MLIRNDFDDFDILRTDLFVINFIGNLHVINKSLMLMKFNDSQIKTI